MTEYIFLVKSEKNRKNCLGCLNEEKKWVRPIKRDNGFLDEEVTMDNGAVIDLFDVVEMEFGNPIPIKHHVENMTFLPDKKMHFIRKLGNDERNSLLKEISNSNLLSQSETKYDLFELIIKSGRSIATLGPIDSFDIGFDQHPKIYFKGKNEHIFNIPCTDYKFCAFVQKKSAAFVKNGFKLNSSQIPELKGKPTYFVIGLTGDHLDEKGNIESGKYGPPDGSIAPRYWPMVVSVLPLPDYV